MTSHRPSPLALFLFCIYVVFYLGFMAISAFAPDLMTTIMPGGVNLAIAYGFGLIIAAFVLSAIYGMFSKSPETTSTKEGEE